jgi:CheY-like chemotaxis protein
MDSSVRPGQPEKEGESRNANAARIGPVRRAWIVGGALDRWWEIMLALQQWGIEVKPLGSDADLTALAVQAGGDGGVIVVDLLDNIDRGIAAITACLSPSVPVPIIAVLAAPAAELAQRLRNLGVFRLALHPLDPAKMRDVLEEAFRHAEQMRARGEGGKKILVIDDDPDYSSSVQTLLQSEGFAVCCAATGSKGLDMAVSEKPDLIVLDVMMENMWAGYEVNQTLKFRSGYESVRRIPVIMVSSVQEDPAERFARSEDPSKVCPDVYMTKPLDIAKFLETVRSLLSAPSTKAAGS